MADDQSRLERAKQLLTTVQNAAMATVNEDGSPHNTPYFFVIDDSLTHLYWASNPAAQHSRNVERNSQLFVVLYEADKGGGLYVAADEAQALAGAALEAGLAVFNARRAKNGKEPLPVSVMQTNAQRLYGATIRTFWVNSGDMRQEVTARDLLA